MLSNIVLGAWFYLLQCVLQVMKLDVQIRETCQLLDRFVSDFLADNHHVGFFDSDSKIITSEVF